MKNKLISFFKYYGVKLTRSRQRNYPKQKGVATQIYSLFYAPSYISSIKLPETEGCDNRKSNQKIQYSVFKGEIRSDDKEKILKWLREIGLGVDDKVHVVELCEHCRKGVIVFGEDITVPQHFVV